MPGGEILQHAVQLAAGQSYLFLFNFKGPPVAGTLVISGRNFWREYPLPASGSEFAFGIGGDRSSAIGLHVPAESGPESVAMRFVSANGSAARAIFADLGIISYSSVNLPFHLISLLPFTVEVNAPRGGWIETPRIFIPGYHATLDGRDLAPERSPDGLVMVRVPSGHSVMALRYDGPPLLRIAFWTSLAAWFGLPAVWLGRAWLPGAAGALIRLHVGGGLFRRGRQRVDRYALPVAVVGFYASIALLGYCNFRRAQALAAANHQRIVPVHFPAGRSGDTVELAALKNPVLTGRLLATYLDRTHIRLQLVQPDGRRSSSGPIFVNFIAEQKIECAQLPGGVRCLFFNNQLIWRSDDLQLPLRDPHGSSGVARNDGDST